MLASVDATDVKIRSAAASGDQQAAQTHSIQLAVNLAADGDTTEAKLATSYAGFVLQDLPKGVETTASHALVKNSREAEIQALKPTITTAIRGYRFTAATPFAFGAWVGSVKVADLAFAPVDRVESGGVTFLSTWSGRSLIIVPERNDLPFDRTKHKSILGYLQEANPQASTNGLIRDAATMGIRP